MNEVNEGTKWVSEMKRDKWSEVNACSLHISLSSFTSFSRSLLVLLSFTRSLLSLVMKGTRRERNQLISTDTSGRKKERKWDKRKNTMKEEKRGFCLLLTLFFFLLLFTVDLGLGSQVGSVLFISLRSPSSNLTLTAHSFSVLLCFV